MWLICKPRKILHAVWRLDDRLVELLDLLRQLIQAVRGRNSRAITITGGDLTFDFPGNISITLKQQPEEDIMITETFTLPADTADGNYSLGPLGQLVDSEGDAITDFTESFVSSDPEVISLTPTDPADIKAGTYHIGKPGVATVTRSLTTKVGRKDQESIVRVSTFVVTAGAPVAVTEGAVTFEGLEPDPA